MKNHRTTILAALAGLTFIAAALAQEGPWTTTRILAVIAGALVAGLGVVAKDAAAPSLPPPAAPPPPPPPETHGGTVEVEPADAWGPRPSER
jgi:hypothetical protein